MASRSFIESDEEDLEFDGNSHTFEPEYTDEELEDMERRQREEQSQKATPMARTRSKETRAPVSVVTLCLPRKKAFAVRSGTSSSPLRKCRRTALVSPTQRNFQISSMGCPQDIFFVPKINWKKRPKWEGPTGQLSVE